jgi:predicted MPP superfamily phosphohydrolase
VKELTVANMFGLFHLAYLDLVVVLPALALLFLVAEAVVCVKRKRQLFTWPVRAAALIALIIAPFIGVYASFIEPHRIVVETTTLQLPNNSILNGPIRIGVLADFQTDQVGDHERRAIDLLKSQRPDVIVIPGDVFQGTSEQFETWLPTLRELFSELDAPGGVYVVPGNCDSHSFLHAMFDGLDNVHVLINETATTTVHGNTLFIGGLADNDFRLDAQAVVARLEMAGASAALRLLIAHRPDAVELMAHDSRIDLLIAGHTHGGQVCIPFFGPLLTLTNVPRNVAAGGLHDMDGRRIYVSRGVGHERGQAPRIRFWCPPEISVITVTTELEK